MENLMGIVILVTHLGTSPVGLKMAGRGKKMICTYSHPYPHPSPTSYQSPAFACYGEAFPFNLLGYCIVTFDFLPNEPCELIQSRTLPSVIKSSSAKA